MLASPLASPAVDSGWGLSKSKFPCPLSNAPTTESELRGAWWLLFNFLLCVTATWVTERRAAYRKQITQGALRQV